MKTRTDAKRAAILDIASQMFLEQGYKGTSMAEISARVGGSKATLYGYFPSKEALFVATTGAISERYMGAVMDELAESSPDDPETALRRFAEHTVEFLGSGPAIATHRMVLAEAGHSDIGRMFFEAGPAEGHRVIAAFLEAAMAGGKLRRSDPDCAALQLFALVQAEIAHRVFYLDLPSFSRGQVKAMADRAMTAFLRGYRPD